MEEHASSALAESRGGWQCPGCREECTQFTCERCGIRRNVVTVANGLAANLFARVEEVFFACLDFHHNRTATTDPMEFAAESQALSSRIDDVLNSADMVGLVASNWRIKDAVKNLLCAAHRGVTVLTTDFGDSAPDSGSMALYTMLIDRLEEKVRQRHLEASLERPNLAALYGRGDWSCPLCATENNRDTEACSSCKCNYFVVQLSTSTDAKTLMDDAEQYFFQVLDVVTDPSLSDHFRQTALQALKEKTDALWKSEVMERLENRNWQIRISMSYLFAELYSGKHMLSFHIPDRYDINSSGFFAIFIRRLMEKKSKLLSEKPHYAEVSLPTPSAQAMTSSDDYEPFESQQFHVSDNVRGFLISNKLVLMMVAEKLYMGFDGHGWVGNLYDGLCYFSDQNINFCDVCRELCLMLYFPSLSAVDGCWELP